MVPNGIFHYLELHLCDFPVDSSCLRFFLVRVLFTLAIIKKFLTIHFYFIKAHVLKIKENELIELLVHALPLGFASALS